MLKIYHNPKCSKSREGLNYLREKGYEYQVIYYLEKPISAGDLKTILMKLNLKPSQVIRTQDKLYRRELKGKSFNDEEWIRILVEYPRLLQRPIVEGKYKAVIAVPAERSEEVMKG